MTLFDTLDPVDRETLSAYFQPASFRNGECLLRQGDEADGCYFIDDGDVRVEVLDRETDSESVLGYLGAGHFIGELALIDRQPRAGFAFAHTAVKARWLSRASFEELCASHPRVGLAISQALARNLTGELRLSLGRLSEYLFAGVADAATDELVGRASTAQRELAAWSEQRIDAMLGAIASELAGRSRELAQACVEETGIGVVEDKVTKIRFGSLGVYAALQGRPSVGAVQQDLQHRKTEIPASMGVVLGLIPLTNPVSTIAFKTLICLKARNALIYSCHHKALGVGNRTGQIIQGVLKAHGAPPEMVQWIRERTSRRKTAMLMHHKGIAFILATGGPSLVKAAYSSGTPTIGVGAGNAPALIAADVDPATVARMVIDSKSFDNGVICASENNLVVEAAIEQAFITALESEGAAVLTAAEKSQFLAKTWDSDGTLDKELIGKPAELLAERAGIHRRCPIRLIVVPAAPDEVDGPLGREKLAPIVSLFTAPSADEGLVLCQRILSQEGRGHTAAIHTRNRALIERFGRLIDASRIIVNLGSTQAAIGIGSSLAPSLTLGCGTFGGNSTTDNVTYTHLLNMKRLVWGAE